MYVCNLDKGIMNPFFPLVFPFTNSGSTWWFETGVNGPEVQTLGWTWFKIWKEQSVVASRIISECLKLFTLQSGSPRTM